MTLFSGDTRARDEYMHELKLQAALDDRALQAVKLLARTGHPVDRP